MRSRNVVTGLFDGVSFSFYTSEEIEKMSVKRITRYPAFDIQGLPIDGGLYDPAMGFTGSGSSCATCSLPQRHCPGHCGHIDLPFPVVHPLLLRHCLRLLRCVCLNCYCLRVRTNTRELLMQLRLIEAGYPVEAERLGEVYQRASVAFKKSATKSSTNEQAEILGLWNAEVRAAEQRAEELLSNTENGTRASRGEHIQDHSATLLLSKKANIYEAALFPLRRCPQCEAYSPEFTLMQKTKIFQKPLPEGAKKRNMKLDIVIKRKVFDMPFDEKPKAAMQRKKSSAKAKRRLGPDEPAGEDIEDESDEEEQQEEVRVREEDEEEEEDKHNVVEDDADNEDSNKWLSPLETREILRRCWLRETKLFEHLFSYVVRDQSNAASMRRVPAPHTMFFVDRVLVPPNRFRPCNEINGMMLEHPQNRHLNAILQTVQQLTEARAEATKVVRLWAQLQQDVSGYYVSDSSAKVPVPGVKQILEKKEGLFRRHMMGKRVNYAARTVISPDPYLDTDEIGIPLVFARKLTFPHPVTGYNQRAMYDAVVNGPAVYPGATAVEKKGISHQLEAMSDADRVRVAKSLLERDPSRPDEAVVVHAHIRTGDVVLVNRQPSLHKPSMMAHKVRVLGEERTLRMHYANCNSYNADFDGDEMNIHFPQNHMARADLRLLAATQHQFLGPKDGSPLRGLIQDHALSGTLLTMKDTFFTKTDYQQLVYGAVFSVRPTDDIECEPPAILKPRPLYTGKQVVSTVVRHILHGRPLFNYSGAAKIKGSSWGPTGEEEGTVMFRGGDMLTGVLDKSQVGNAANGFVHACYALYGGDIAERLLSCLGRLLTHFLQHYGFTCGMDDLMLDKKSEQLRVEMLSTAVPKSETAARSFLGPSADDREVETLPRMLQSVLLRNGAPEEARLDTAMKKVSAELSSKLVDSTVPNGLLKPFPRNNFYMMVASGAKGSTVNLSMITCCLGQMELEGRRVARLISGRTLPSFKPYQIDVVAGGFIGQRFLTGVKPREFYFHCMAGREGLVDTAVKTARSGYLQRCIIKHLETLYVAYDGTVRDTDEGLVQVRYGDDGLDPTHFRTVYNFSLWKQNEAVALSRVHPKLLQDAAFHPDVMRYRKEQQWSKNAPVQGHRMRACNPQASIDEDCTLLDKYTPNMIGVVSDRFLNEMQSNRVSEKLQRVMMAQYLRWLAPPGESVGVLAGQSIGEPSTQMTLNTFHLAGHGDVNVTLGIPRLRELLMSAGKPKTPSMVVPFLPDADPQEVEKTKNAWLNAPLQTLVAELVTTRGQPIIVNEDKLGETVNTIYLRFDKTAIQNAGLTWDDVVQLVRDKLLKAVCADIENDSKRKVRHQADVVERARSAAANSHVLHEDDDDADAEVANDDRDDDRDLRGQRRDEEEADARGEPAKDDEEDDDEDDKKKGKGKDKDADDEVEEVEDDDNEDAEKKEEADEEEEKQQRQDEESDDFTKTPADRLAQRSGVVDWMTRQFQETKSGIDEEGFILIDWPDMKKLQFVRVLGLGHNEDQLVVRFKIMTQDVARTVLVSTFVVAALQRILVRNLPGITRVVFADADRKGPARMITEGVNLFLLAEYGHVFDTSQVKCNDIHALLNVFGVEAARAAVVEEIGAVFQAYGVSVGQRHLSLIADYVCYHGGYRGFNRSRMQNHKDSPFLCMSFETSLGFAVDAAANGKYDDCRSPAARIVVGLAPRCGVLWPMALSLGAVIERVSKRPGVVAVSVVATADGALLQCSGDETDETRVRALQFASVVRASLTAYEKLQLREKPEVLTVRSAKMEWVATMAEESADYFILVLRDPEAVVKDQ